MIYKYLLLPLLAFAHLSAPFVLNVNETRQPVGYKTDTFCFNVNDDAGKCIRAYVFKRSLADDLYIYRGEKNITRSLSLVYNGDGMFIFKGESGKYLLAMRTTEDILFDNVDELVVFLKNNEN